MFHSSTCLLAACVFYLISIVRSAPVLTTRQTFTTLSSTQISAYDSYTYFASAGYCPPNETKPWSCGINCNANAAFEVVASGGDGSATQYWFVGYNPPSGDVIVSHQGTNVKELLADLTDLDIFFQTLDPTLFPGVSTSVIVHMGFAQEQAKTAQSILSNVSLAMARYSTTKVTVVGHSLGGAIALLDSVYLPLHLPTTTVFKTITYGMPRVGNQAFANYVDANAHVTHINNKEDPIPIVPGRFLGFVHPAGETHIQDSEAWVLCPGQDNSNDLCIIGDVPNIFESDESDHSGPYNGISIGC